MRTSPPAPPSSRSADTLRTTPVIDRPVPVLAEDHLGWLITSLATRLSRGASHYYQQHHGLGSTEYRLVLALGQEGSCSAIRAAAAADVDKAAASRSLQVLLREHLVEAVRHGREMDVRLSPAGHKLLATLRAATRRRDARLTRGMTDPEVAALRSALRRLIDNLPHMQEP